MIEDIKTIILHIFERWTTPIEINQSVEVSRKYDDWSPFVVDVKRDHFDVILGLLTLATNSESS